MRSVRILVLAGALLLGGASESIAATTYQYTGKLFTLFSGTTYDTSDRVTITLVLSSPLTSNYTGPSAIDIAPLILSYTFDDGMQTLTSENSSFHFDDVFTTDANGLPTGWSLYVSADGSLDPPLISSRTNTPRDIGQIVDWGLDFDNGTWVVVPGESVVDADGHVKTPPGHPGAIFDEGTGLLWLDAIETDGRSLADVSSKLGPSDEFDGWRLGTRDELLELFVNAELYITSHTSNPPFTDEWREDSDLVSDVMDFVGIYGMTQPNDFCGAMGMNVWHANTHDDPQEYAAEATLWDLSNGCFGNDGVPAAWVGDNGIDSFNAGAANFNYGVALVYDLPEPSSTWLGGAALLALASLARRRARRSS